MSVAQGQDDGERATCAKFAGEADFTIHQLDELFDDGEAQAAAAILAGQAVIDLAERFEDEFLRFWRDAGAGIAYSNAPVSRVVLVKVDANFAGLGKFDGIPAQVDQDLFQPLFIAVEAVGERGDDFRCKGQPFVACQHGQARSSFLEQGGRGENPQAQAHIFSFRVGLRRAGH